MKYSIFIIFISYIASPKFCLHCTHFIPDKMGNEFGTCKNFPVKTTDSSFLVTGKKKQENKYNYCSTARTFDHMCGDYANHYFPKNKDTDIDIVIEPTDKPDNGGWNDDLSGIIDSVFS